MSEYEILHGDCREVLATLPECSVDAIVTDPPYELGFMGKGWDRTGVANDPETWRGEGNTHPTVKPTELMRYLVRLVTPSGGVVLDPFVGSGSTGKAAVSEGFRFLGIEKTAEYLPIIQRRIQAALEERLW